MILTLSLKIIIWDQRSDSFLSFFRRGSKSIHHIANTASQSKHNNTPRGLFHAGGYSHKAKNVQCRLLQGCFKYVFLPTRAKNEREGTLTIAENTCSTSDNKSEL